MRGLGRLAAAIQGLILLPGLCLPLIFFFAVTDPGSAAGKIPWDAVWGSLLFSTACAALGTSSAFLFSWFLWRYRWPSRLQRALTLTLKLPYLLPPLFFAMGWLVLAAPGVGYFNLLSGRADSVSIYGQAGAIFVFSIWTTALAMIQLSAFFEQIPRSFEDAAVLAGASPVRALFSITIPTAASYLRSTFLLTMVASLAAFAVPALIALPARHHVLTTRIYQTVKGGDFSQPALLSVLLLVLTFFILGMERLATRRAPRISLLSGKASQDTRFRASAGAHLVFGSLILVVTFTTVFPFLAVLHRSLLIDPAQLSAVSFENYRSVFFDMPEAKVAVRNSLITAGMAASAATLIAITLAYALVRYRERAARILAWIGQMGASTPGTVLALALLVFFAGRLTDTLWILALAYYVKYVSYALNTVAPSLEAVPLEMEQAAWMSGASPRQAFFRILLPLLKPALAAAFVLSFVPMFSEITMSVFLSGAGTETIGTLIYRYLEYANPGAASVLATLLVAVTLLANALLRTLSKGRFGI